jgi:hypothetical protein
VRELPSAVIDILRLRVVPVNLLRDRSVAVVGVGERFPVRRRRK